MIKEEKEYVRDLRDSGQVSYVRGEVHQLRLEMSQAVRMQRARETGLLQPVDEPFLSSSMPPKRDGLWIGLLLACFVFTGVLFLFGWPEGVRFGLVQEYGGQAAALRLH